MAVTTRFLPSAGLCWLTILLAATVLPAAEAEPPRADEPATETAEPASEPSEIGSAERLSMEQRRIAEKFRHLGFVRWTAQRNFEAVLSALWRRCCCEWPN